MTEKQFTYNVNKNTIECDGKFVAYVNCVDGFRIANKMNILQKENEQLKQELQKIQDGFELNWTQNRVEFDKDKLYIKDVNTEICLDSRDLSIRVYIPSLNEYYLFKYKVTGRSLMKEFVEKYNSKGDDKMSEERFYLDENGINDREYEFGVLGEDELVDIINGIVDENKQLKTFLEALKEELSFANRDNDVLEEENEQLKQRNDRQAKRLAELYELMAKKDWESLTEIIDDFCSCEEQLQRESGTYGGLK